jgi:hypothetical protein
VLLQVSYECDCEVITVLNIKLDVIVNTRISISNNTEDMVMDESI